MVCASDVDLTGQPVVRRLAAAGLTAAEMRAVCQCVQGQRCRRDGNPVFRQEGENRLPPCRPEGHDHHIIARRSPIETRIRQRVNDLAIDAQFCISTAGKMALDVFLQSYAAIERQAPDASHAGRVIEYDQHGR